MSAWRGLVIAAATWFISARRRRWVLPTSAALTGKSSMMRRRESLRVIGGALVWRHRRRARVDRVRARQPPLPDGRFPATELTAGRPHRPPGTRPPKRVEGDEQKVVVLPAMNDMRSTRAHHCVRQPDCAAGPILDASARADAGPSCKALAGFQVTQTRSFAWRAGFALMASCRDGGTLEEGAITSGRSPRADVEAPPVLGRQVSAAHQRRASA